MKLKALIVDDHEVARMGLTSLLESWGFEVAGSVSDGPQAISILASKQIDVVLLDVRMPPPDGLATLQRIRETDSLQHPHPIPVILLSGYDNPTYVARAAALKAHDYILKQELRVALGKSLQRITENHPLPSENRLSTIRSIMDEEIDAGILPPELPITSREAQTLRHVALGLSNKEIARSLGISVETVKEHVQNILRKTKANDRTDAAVKAIKLGLVQ